MKQLQAHIEIRKTHCNVWGSSSYDSYSVIVLIRYYRFEAIDISAWFQQGTQAGEAHATIGGIPFNYWNAVSFLRLKLIRVWASPLVIVKPIHFACYVWILYLRRMRSCSCHVTSLPGGFVLRWWSAPLSWRKILIRVLYKVPEWNYVIQMSSEVDRTISNESNYPLQVVRPFGWVWGHMLKGKVIVEVRLGKPRSGGLLICWHTWDHICYWQVEL